MYRKMYLTTKNPDIVVGGSADVKLKQLMYEKSRNDYENIPAQLVPAPLEKYHIKKRQTIKHLPAEWDGKTRDDEDDDDDDVADDNSPEELKEQIISRISNTKYRTKSRRLLNILLSRYQDPEIVDLRDGKINLNGESEQLHHVLYDLSAMGLAKRRRTSSNIVPSLTKLLGLHLAKRKPAHKKKTFRSPGRFKFLQ